MNGVAIGMGIAAVGFGLSTAYVAMGNTIPTMGLVIVGTAITVICVLGAISGAFEKEEV